MLVLELMELDIGRDRLGHIGPALLGPRRYTEEGAEVVGKGRRDLEDGELARLGLLTLNRLLRPAAALVGLLLEARNTLL